MLRRRRWLAVLAAVLIVAVVEALFDTAFDAVLAFPLRTIVVSAIVGVVVATGAFFSYQLIDRLHGDVVERNETLERRNASLRAVYELSLLVARQADPEETLQAVVERARQLLRVDAALLTLCGEDDEVTLRAASAEPGVLADQTEARPGFGRPSLTGDLGRYLAPGFVIGIEESICHGEACVGTLGVATKEPRTFSEDEVGMLSALATQAGLALEAARLQQEHREVAVQNERERIAREMHDGLAQVLAYVNTKSQAVDELLATGRTGEAARQMQELAAAARSMYVDVREAILSLSPPLLPEKGLPRALEEYGARFAESSKLAVRFQATPEARRVSLKPEVGAEVFGVAREALTNVRKHAHAQRVTLGLDMQDDDLLIRITDDGVGFDPSEFAGGPEKWPHFGLAGMRERAEAVGGRIAWHSKPGAGSMVELRVPVKSSGRNRSKRRSGPPDGATRRKRRHQTVQSPIPTHSEAE